MPPEGTTQRTPLDLELVIEALDEAAGLIAVRRHRARGDVAGAYRERLELERARQARHGGAHALLLEAAEEAERLLERAVEREREAREAQELAVRALRRLGTASASWERIGELAGMTQQGAHRRFRKAAARGRAQLTLVDAGA